jgi:hypothetical protein
MWRTLRGVEDNRPSDTLLRLVNPVLRTLVPSPAGRLVPGSVGVLRFTGRRSGRTLRIVAGIHDVDGRPIVVTSRPWRLNFRGGREVAVARAGRWQSGTATLVDDADEVAAALNHIFRSGTSPRTLGLRVPEGHVLDADDVRATARTLIRLDLAVTR